MKSSLTRVERDSMGEVSVPAGALYGASTQRAVQNFPISDLRLAPEFISALALIKLCAARVNARNGSLSRKKAGAIVKAAREVIAGRFYDQFVVDVFQTGSGTSTNTNMNEVLARRARLIMREDPDDRDVLHPNDHVNLGQSSNDVIPTALHLSALVLSRSLLLPALAALEEALASKAEAFADIVKNGRTHHQDAVPIRLGQEFSGYAAQIGQAARSIDQTAERLHYLAIGGTAVGTGVNSAVGFGSDVCAEISQFLGIAVEESENHFRSQATIDDVVAFSATLRTLALAYIKIVNDLRWMSSGPSSGLSEISIPAVQPGSSIMPGKVNPVILESAHMAALQVLGADTVIAYAAQSGSFELNATLPVVAFNLLQAIKLLAVSADNMRQKCIDGIEPNPKGLSGVERNNALATALNPVIGYDRAAAIAKIVSQTGESVLAVALRETGMAEAELKRLLDPLTMTAPGNAVRAKKTPRARTKNMASNGKKGYRVGDRVEFLGYKTAISWGDRKPQRYGFIESIDGAYINVRPRWWPEGEVIERYPAEIKPA
ncbi:MAG: class II fumarate hydratase [Candidatus Obscuribacterales bacterium]|nr:class II fumarate hydratase [Cyanobacteria bacterium HKST-UBA01]MCB9466979.1 class II fumarate hydratase [Candidatus Obscuribacterales bacterium]